VVGATRTQNAAINGEPVDLTLEHTASVRKAQIVYELTSHLVLHKWREPGGAPKLHLFGQLKRIAAQWLDEYLVCQGGTYPSQLKYKALADAACEKITAGIVHSMASTRPVVAMTDPYTPVGSTAHVNFTTSKTTRWKTAPDRCHVDWVITDSAW
jgi:type III restriction enzyme